MWNKSPYEQRKRKHRVLKRETRLFKPCRPASPPREEKVDNLAFDQASRKGMDITFWPSTKRRGFCLAKTDKTESKGDQNHDAKPPE
jgi:hypothetical protein